MQRAYLGLRHYVCKCNYNRRVYNRLFRKSSVVARTTLEVYKMNICYLCKEPIDDKNPYGYRDYEGWRHTVCLKTEKSDD